MLRLLRLILQTTDDGDVGFGKKKEAGDIIDVRKD